MAVGLRFLLCDGCLAGDPWGPSSARDECLHVLFGRITRGFERRVRILEPCDCLGKKRRSPEGLLHDRFDTMRTAAFGAVGAMRRLSLSELKVHKVPVAQPPRSEMRCAYAASLLPNTRVAITIMMATAMPPISEGQGEPVKPATRYPNKQMTATREA